MSTTIYDINTRYTLEDKTSGALQHMGQSADNTWEKFKRLGELLTAGYGLREAFRKGKEYFIDFNSQMQNLNISEAAVLQGYHLADSFDDARVKAKGMVDEFQRFALTSPTTTKNIAEFSQGIIAGVAGAKGGLKDIQLVAEQGVIAAKVLGSNSEYAGLEITESIQRGVSARMRFAKQLLAFADVDDQKFNQLTESGRLKVLEKALSSGAMKTAAEEYGKSWDGVISTLEDNIQIVLGKVGLPLFKEITAEIQRWDNWLTANKTTVEEIGKEAGQYLVEGFRDAKDAVVFIIDHKDTLLDIANAFLALKTLNMLPNVLGEGGALGKLAAIGGKVGAAAALGTAGYLAGSSGSAGSTALGVGMGVLGAAAMIPGPQQPFVAGAAATVYVGKIVADYIEDKGAKEKAEQAREEARKAQIQHWEGYLTRLDSRTGWFGDRFSGSPQILGRAKGEVLQEYAPLVQEIKQFGDYTAEGAVKIDSLIDHLSATGMPLSDSKKLAYFVSDLFKFAWRDQLLKVLGLDKGKPNKLTGDTHINIARMTVASDDPDRFAMGLKRLAAKQLRNRSIARDALPAGG